MSKAQLVITAVVLEGRSKSEVARDYDVSRYWVQQLIKRYETEGAAAFEPHSRRPRHNMDWRRFIVAAALASGTLTAAHTEPWCATIRTSALHHHQD